MDGDPTADLFEYFYSELRRLAYRRMASERPGHTLQPTALLHEVVLRLLAEERTQWNDRSQFFAAAAMAMRRILVEEARRRRSLKRGADAPRVEAEHELLAFEVDPTELLDLDEALTELERHDERLAQVVQLRYFGGLTIEEAASALDMSPRTVRRDWEAARLWLFRRIADSHDSTGGESSNAS